MAFTWLTGITVDGKVGIGTDSPLGKLHIQGTNSANGGIKIQNSGGNPYAIYSDNNNLIFTNGNGSTTALTINYSGYVGIGTNSPAYSLVIAKKSIAEPALMIGGAFYGGPRIQTYGLDADVNAWMGLGTDMGVGSYEHSVYFPAHSLGKLTFGTYDGTTYSTKAIILQNGNVGIGTTSPSAKLEVLSAANTSEPAFRVVSSASLANNDIVRFQVNGLTNGFRMFQDALSVLNYTFQEGNVGIGTTNPGAKLEVFGTGNSLRLDSSANGSKEILFRNVGTGIATIKTDGDLKLFVEDAGKNILFDTTSGEAMRITSAGDVDIGFAGGGYRLNVGVSSYGAYSVRASGRIYSDTNTTGQTVTGLDSGIFGSNALTSSHALDVTGTSFLNGYVGIGTTSPTAFLHLKGGLSYGSFRISPSVANGESAMAFFTDVAGTNTSNAWVIGHAGWGHPGDFVIGNQAGGGPLVLVQQNGYVGIGTTSPGYKLDVLGTGYYSGQLTIDGFTNNSGISFRKGYSPTNTGIRAKAVATANRDGLELLGYNGIDFTVNNGANVAMRIVGVAGSGMGNVGIGTTSPGENLSIVGASTQGQLSLQAGPTTYAGYKFRMSAQAAEMGFIMEMGGTKILKSYGYNNADSVGLGILNNEDLIYMRAGGNVGIGTTSPTQAKLCVIGAIFQTGDLTLADQNTYSPEIKMTNSAHTIGIDYQNNETLRFITRSGATTVPITFQMRAGTITATNFILSSDERKKTKVKDLSRDSISVNWKSFEMKENEGEYRAGVIAQELEEKHPEFVRTDDEGMKSVAYIDLLIAKIAELEARLEKLEK